MMPSATGCDPPWTKINCGCLSLRDSLIKAIHPTDCDPVDDFDAWRDDSANPNQEQDVGNVETANPDDQRVDEAPVATANLPRTSSGENVRESRDLSRWQFPSVVRQPTPNLPSSPDWLQEIQTRWRALQMPDVPLASSESAGPVTTARSVGTIVNRFDDAVRAAFQSRQIPVQITGRSRLRIEVDRQLAYVDDRSFPLATRAQAIFLDELVSLLTVRLFPSAKCRAGIPNLKDCTDRFEFDSEIASLYESRPGGGYRLRPEALT